jgi:hypothetical protein
MYGPEVVADKQLVAKLGDEKPHLLRRVNADFIFDDRAG